jgi:S1-C subfamily serine protease
VLQRVINYFFALVITLLAILVLVLMVITFPAQADTGKGMDSLRKTVVQVNGTGCMGSGSIVEGKSGKRYIVTNAHVCHCTRWKGNINATFETGELVVGKIVKQEWASDLCAARVVKDLPALKLAPNLLPLQEVNTRGYPGGRLTESHGRVRGMVDWEFAMDISMLGECPAGSKKQYGFDGVLYSCLFRWTSVVTDLYSRPGASGSPVVDDNGGLVGVVSSWLAGSDSESGMVPFHQVKRFLEGL